MLDTILGTAIGVIFGVFIINLLVYAVFGFDIVEEIRRRVLR